MEENILTVIRNAGIVPVVKLDDASKTVALGKALLDGGIPVAEITFRTGGAASSIAQLRDNLPDLVTGAGTVLSVEQAKQAKQAGARFIVSPGFNEAVVDYCLGQGIPVIPGVNSPDGIEKGMAKGLSVLKFFPAEASGGTAMLRAFSGPYGLMNFLPTGGINLQNLSQYIRIPSVWAVGGTWMIDQDAIAKGDWEHIRKLCHEAVIAMHGFTLAHLGMNLPDETAAGSVAAALGNVFGFTPRETAVSYFMSEVVEVMKAPVRGQYGHIAMRVNDVERALAYLQHFGYKPLMETAKMEGGHLKFVYVDKEIGGFALHLTRA